MQGVNRVGFTNSASAFTPASGQYPLDPMEPWGLQFRGRRRATRRPVTIAQALVGAGALRAVELDINPEWVAGYLYEHRGGSPTAVPVVAGQLGIPGRLLSPYGRDFFTIAAN